VQAGDVLLAVNGQPADLSGDAPVTPPTSWPARGHFTYTVRRGAATLQLDAQLAQPPADALLRFLRANLLDSLLQLAAVGMLVFIFLRRPGSLAAQALLLLAAVFMAMWLATLLPDDTATLVGPSFWLGVWQYYRTWVWAGFFFPTLVLLALVFPRPNRVAQRHPVLVSAALFGLLPALRLVFGNQWQVGWGLVAVFGALALLSLGHTLLVVRRDAVARAQAKWVLAALAAVVGYQALYNGLLLLFPDQFAALARQPLFGFIEQGIGSAIPLALPICLGIAITRYHLFDIDIIIRRTLLYSLLTALLAAVYFGSVVVLQALLTALTPLSGAQAAGAQRSGLVTVLSTLAIAALFVPLRRRLQAFIDHRFYRHRYDASQTLAAFAQAARDEVDLDRLTEHLLQVAQESLQPATLNLWLAPPGDDGQPATPSTAR